MKIENTVYIEASPETVWQVTLDVERWPEWTPTVQSVKKENKGPIDTSSVVRLKQPMQPETKWIVTHLENGKLFAWESRRKGLRITGIHEIFHESNGTKNVLRAEADGILAVLLWPLLKIAMQKALADENKGLKMRCEAIKPHKI